jgi:hypothetical protein
MAIESLFMTDYGPVRLRDGVLVERGDPEMQRLAHQQWARVFRRWPAPMLSAWERICAQQNANPPDSQNNNRALTADG